MHLPSLYTSLALGLLLGLSACKPDPTVKYVNAPDSADPQLKIITFTVTPNANPVPFEADTDQEFGGYSNNELLVWGRADHSAGIATMKMTLMHDNSVANVASFTQSGAMGSQVANPVTIYGSDGLGGVGALRPFSFKLTDEKYSVILTASDAAGHTRTIKVKYVYVRGSTWVPPGNGGFGTTDGNTSMNSSSGPMCTCPDSTNAACGSRYGASCTTDAECVPGSRCGIDPLGPPSRNSCVKINNGCPEVTCWKPVDLSYDRTKCFAPEK